MSIYTHIHTRPQCHRKNSMFIHAHTHTRHHYHHHHSYRETFCCPAAQRYYDEKKVDRFGLYGAVIGFFAGLLTGGVWIGLLSLLVGVLLGALLGRIIVIFQ